jgi:hypothetical protein
MHQFIAALVSLYLAAPLHAAPALDQLSFNAPTAVAAVPPVPTPNLEKDLDPEAQLMPD